MPQCDVRTKKTHRLLSTTRNILLVFNESGLRLLHIFENHHTSCNEYNISSILVSLYPLHMNNVCTENIAPLAGYNFRSLSCEQHFA